MVLGGVLATMVDMVISLIAWVILRKMVRRRWIPR